MYQIGIRPRLYRFRIESGAPRSRCPRCGQLARKRRVAFVVHVDGGHTLAVQAPCHYCRRCDLLCVGQGDLDARLAGRCLPSHPEIVGRNYLVLGTMDAAEAARCTGFALAPERVASLLHEFASVDPSDSARPARPAPARMLSSRIPLRRQAVLG